MKCVMVLANDLSRGLAVNAAGVLPPDAVDGSDRVQAGLTNRPLPILVAGPETFQVLRARATEGGALLGVDFDDVAQRARRYSAVRSAFWSIVPPEVDVRWASPPGDLRRRAEDALPPIMERSPGRAASGANSPHPLV